MSDIKIGDLVMVVKPSPCCGNASDIGTIFTVSLVETCNSTCKTCGHHWDAEALASEVGDDDGGWPTSRLKKIDPPAEGDNLPTHRDLEVAA